MGMPDRQVPCICHGADAGCRLCGGSGTATISTDARGLQTVDPGASAGGTPDEGGNPGVSGHPNVTAPQDAGIPRSGDWMQTYNSGQFWPLDSRPQDFDIEVIAHSLGMQCRYNGHTKSFYSVAEHSILVSENVSPENAMWALMHDAAEAYIGDIVRPLKRNLPNVADIEAGLLANISLHFNLTGWTYPAEVAEVDTRILLDERAQMLHDPPAPWGFEHMGELGVEIVGYNPREAKDKFLERFVALGGLQ